MLEMTIVGVKVCPMNGKPALFLRGDDTDLYLPIFISPEEADAIVLTLQGTSSGRPSTHDLLYRAFVILNGSLEYVRIRGGPDDIAYAEILLRVGGELKNLDSRLGDAVALALRARAPIYAEESVLDSAGFALNQETGETIPLHQFRMPTRAQPDEAEQAILQTIVGLDEFIDTLDLEDFG